MIQFTDIYYEIFLDLQPIKINIVVGKRKSVQWSCVFRKIITKNNLILSLFIIDPLFRNLFNCSWVITTRKSSNRNQFLETKIIRQ